MRKLRFTIALSLTALCASAAFAQEANIRAALAKRLPNVPTIDTVTETAVPGLYEVVFNQSDIVYSDANGDHIFQGSLIETATKTNLTQQRSAKLSAVDFKSLPTKDAITFVRGKGERKLAVFSDPNCGYCKRFEQALSKVDNITVHLFLIPILSADSLVKANNIWCAADKKKAYESWMLRTVTPPNAQCDAEAITRNVALARKLKVTGTPILFFSDGNRVSGMLPITEVEKHLARAAH